MNRTILTSTVALLVLALLTTFGTADTRKWDSKTEHRAETAAFADADIETAVKARFSADNDLVGSEITLLGIVPGGKEYTVKLIFEAVGLVPDQGDIEATVFVSTDLSDSYVVDYDDPASSNSANPGGGEINNSIEFDAAAAAFADDDVKTELDSRFDAGVQFLDWDVEVISSDPSGTVVDVTMDSDSTVSGEGDVVATVLVGATSAVVTNVTAY